jgi:hypothetical protein
MRINYAWIMLRRKTFHAANANTAMQTKFVAAYGTRGLSQKLADDLAASNCRLPYEQTVTLLAPSET